MELEPHN